MVTAEADVVASEFINNAHKDSDDNLQISLKL